MHENRGYDPDMIVSHVSRERLGRDLHHPLRYAEIEGSIGEDLADKLFIYAQFHGGPSASAPAHRAKPRPVASREYRELVRLHYHPAAHRVDAPPDAPWTNVADPIVIHADIWPLEREVTQWLPALRAFLGESLRKEVAKRTQKGLPSDRWLVHVALLPETSELEIGVTTWTDLRRNDEQVKIVTVP